MGSDLSAIWTVDNVLISDVFSSHVIDSLAGTMHSVLILKRYPYSQ